MYVRKKVRSRILVVVLLVLGFVTWRGLRATTKDSFNCQYKLVYAVCVPKKTGAVLPSLFDIAKAGASFNFKK